ncbi:MAG TPA: hypothetical protein VK497_02135 [Candidatus Saccharimonadales bacterium]|nr:hypothetical protein [Candidatus Saccharimonadales bacterium]
MATKKQQANDQANSAGGTVLAGCVVIGAGLGFLADELVVGAVLGTGVGLLVMGLMMVGAKK